ncbi:MAG: glycosyltransferase [Pseudobacter sp.]|uniref:glycosyltransferase n=1 Tax=Pseudobacter sp. TaxID=2045420 RepID=UPI003F7F832D
MAVHDTEENKRTELTDRTLECLLETVNLSRHRIFIIDNDSCKASKDVIQYHMEMVNKRTAKLSGRNLLITSDRNLGTAKAINHALRYRQHGELVIKMDNDVIIHKDGWVDEMEDVMRRMPQIGILGLKRPDLQESTYAIQLDYRSKLLEVPHEPGQRWRVVEECKHVMGTCTMINPALLDKIGYFYQMEGLYGFDDSLLCVRSQVAGFINCFLHGIDIDHIDPGNTAYSDWKNKHAGDMLVEYARTETAYRNGTKDIYYGGE